MHVVNTTGFCDTLWLKPPCRSVSHMIISSSDLLKVTLTAFACHLLEVCTFLDIPLEALPMGCLQTKHAIRSPHLLDTREVVALAAETSCEKVDLPDFVNIATGTLLTVSEVEALYELFRKISNSIIKDNLIHKEEFHLALFRSKKKQNLFVDRSVIYKASSLQHRVDDDDDLCFSSRINSMCVFHPDAPEEQKVAFAFKLYDLRQTGFIERHELKEMVLALLDESDLDIASDAVEMIVDRTFDQADTKGYGKIDQEEWTAYAKDNPYVLRNMTLPYLKSHMVLLPKKPGANVVSAFRPFCLQNCCVKILSKILTTTVQTQINNLMGLDQTGFIKGRSITENFVYAMELIQCCHKRKNTNACRQIGFCKSFPHRKLGSLRFSYTGQRLHPHLAKMDAAHSTIISISGIG
ncbi:unnamed protein product [Miscanthus lutarioriparius]|uniref:Calcineurin B-like protein n=1 Tax=Miscanthus lutarioriparius TaxID=422564 RepID=A0A811NWL3_9POAL|nr:unnamed protein product [Miscanthus lutarioriparius]